MCHLSHMFPDVYTVVGSSPFNTIRSHWTCMIFFPQNDGALSLIKYLDRWISQKQIFLSDLECAPNLSLFQI